LPLSLQLISTPVKTLLSCAAESLTKAAADTARESTFEFLQCDDPAIVEVYTPVYAAAQLLYAQGCYFEATAMMPSLLDDISADSQAHDHSTSAVKLRDDIIMNLDACLRAVDLALLRTSIGDWSQVARPLLQCAESLRATLLQWSQDESKPVLAAPTTTSTAYPPQFLIDAEKGSEIPRIDASQMTAATFLEDHMTSSPEPSPVILCNAISSWPALQKWRDVQYLKQMAAGRLVPVETCAGKDATQTYLTDTWEQQVMSFGDFVDSYVTKPDATARKEEEEKEEERGYLAQYQLFEQIPSLLNDIVVPPLCSALTPEDTASPPHSESTPPSSPLVSAWFGPAGTVSPLHNDPYHNLLAQVVGSKYLRLYPVAHTHNLYPREGPLCNNSHIDLDAHLSATATATVTDAGTAGLAEEGQEQGKAEKYPRFSGARFQHCVLRPGELLYIPRHHWHYVRSLETSFSTSFWWGAKMALQREEPGSEGEGDGGVVRYCACY
jgi:lysine-specific demethylase 8